MGLLQADLAGEFGLRQAGLLAEVPNSLSERLGVVDPVRLSYPYIGIISSNG